MTKKAIAFGIVSLFVISGLVGMLLIIPGEVEAPGPTYVSGIISVNTTWTVDDSPYIIIDNTTLNTGVILTIEAGTEIKFKDNTCLAIRGKLHVKGNSTNLVVFTNEDPLINYSVEYQINDGLYHDETYYNGSGIDYYVNIETSNGGMANISYAKFEYSSHSSTLLLQDNDDKIPEDIVTDTLFINNKRGISGAQFWDIKRCTFEKNWNGIDSKVVDIYDCVFKNNTFGEHRGDGDYYNCNFIENTYGIYSYGGPHAKFSTFSNNKIGMCGQIGALNNTITNNKLGIIHYEGPIYPIEYNNIHSNIDYNLKLYGSQNRNVPHNWWGTTNTTVIDQYIYDIYDDPTLGEAIYEPFLTDPNPNAPKGSGLQEGAPWPMFRGNVRHTGLSPYDTSGNPGELKWKYSPSMGVGDPVIGLDGTIYFGSYNYNLYAINPNGTEKWIFETDYQISSSPAIGSDGTIYIGSKDNNLYAINPNGSEKWNFTTGDWIESSPAIGYEGTIYMGSHDNKLYAIYPNGTKKWSFDTFDAVKSSPAIGSDGTIYIGSDNGKIYAIYPNGTEKWNFITGSGIRSSPAIGSDGTIYVGDTISKFYAINPNGTEKWSYTTGAWIDSSPAIGSDGILYVGSDDNKLYAFYPNGTIKWSFVTFDAVRSSPVIGSDGTIYIGSHDDKLYALNPNGTQKWSFNANNNIQSSPAIDSNGTIYFCSGSLYAIGERLNQPPLTPTTPSGLTSGLTNISYSFSTSTTDPDSDQIKYGWDWNGNGTVDEWSGLVDSGTEDNRFHSWSAPGIYDIKVKAQDEYGEESDWSDVLSITIIEPPIPESPEIIGTIPDIELSEDFILYQIDLSSFAYDPQDPLSELKWYITGMDTSIASIDGENQTGNHNLSFESQDDMSGNMEVTYWLVDTEGNTAFQNAWINVTPVNDPPIISKCPVIAIHVDTPYTFNFTFYIVDIDSSISELFLTCSDPAHTSINGLEVTFVYPESMAGQTVYVNLSVSDGAGSVNDTIEIILVKEIDTDSDGIPDSEDEDDDNDGYNDDIDLFPLDPTEWMDSDYDGIGNNADLDDDNDGYDDDNDMFPLDHTEWLDTDGDGIGDNADLDDDNDGHNDEEDYYPKDPTRWSLQTDISVTSMSVSKYGSSAGEEVTIYVEIWNTEDNDCDVIVKYYDGHPNDGGSQIGYDHEITIMSDSSVSVTQSWITTAGNHTLYVVVEDLTTGEEVTAYLPITVGENIQPVLVLTTGDMNIYRFEPGQERTISVEVTCYRQTVSNVHLVVLDDQNLTIDNTITPSITMTDGQTTKFYLRIKAPHLPEGVDKLEKDILIQAVGDNGIFSNAEELDIVVSESAISLFDPFFVMGAVATGSLATLGAAAAASRRDENWKYLLLLTFAVPLYTRIHGKKTLDNFVRGQVYGHIQSKPGTHFNDIKKTLKVGNGNLAYHLRKLEKEGFIKSSRDKRYRRFYPVGIEVVEDEGIKLSKTQESILDYIEQHPKSNQKEIAKELKESQQTISYNLNVLVREGFITEEKFKGAKRYEIIEENT